jgi:hypothetical protein
MSTKMADGEGRETRLAKAAADFYTEDSGVKVASLILLCVQISCESGFTRAVWGLGVSTVAARHSL